MVQVPVVQFEDLTEEQIEELIDEMEPLFLGLPMVTGAPVVVGGPYYRELARHLLELGVRIVADPIKTYSVPTVADGPRSAGKWTYHAGVQVETPRDRIRRQVRAERAEYEAEVARRERDGTLRSKRPEFGNPVQPAATSRKRKRR